MAYRLTIDMAVFNGWDSANKNRFNEWLFRNGCKATDIKEVDIFDDKFIAKTLRGQRIERPISVSFKDIT